MDVRCEKCQTEYELDEARLKPGGVTVKCTNCGHMFKIRKRSNTNVGVPASVTTVASAPTASAAERPRTQSAGTGPTKQPRADSILGDEAPTMPIAGDERQWLIRLENGEQKSCRELAMLQQWIVAGVVTRESLISRTGKTWKRLGDISELAQYFTIADEARTQRQDRSTKPTGNPKPKEGTATMLGIGVSAAGGTILPDDDSLDGRTTGNFPSRGKPTPPPIPAKSEAPARRPLTQPPPPPPPAKKAQSQSGPLPTPERPERSERSERSERVDPPAKPAPSVPISNRSTAAWATEGISPTEPTDEAGPAGPFGGRIKAASNEPAFAGRVRVMPGDESNFKTGKVETVDDDDDVLPSQRGSRGGAWLLVMALLVMGAAAGVVYVFVIRKGKTEEGAKPPPDAAAVAAVPDAAVATPALPDAAIVTPPPQGGSAIDLARAELGADLELKLRDALKSLDGKTEPGTEAVRAHLSSQIAQGLLDRASVTADKAEAEKLKKDAKTLVIDAATGAQRAFKAAPDDAAANLAMGEVLRLQGKPAKDVKRYLETAKAKASADWKRDLALAEGLVLARDGKLDDAKTAFAAIDTGEDKLESSGDVRARFHLALVTYAQNKPGEAKPLVDQVLAAQPEHAGARALAARIETTVVKSDPLPPEDGSGGGSATKTGSGGTGPGPGPGPDVSAGGTYDSVLAKANKLAESNCAKAADLYAKALELKPNGVEALTGMGYCHIDAKQYSSAFSKFRAALAISSRYEPALWGIAEAYVQQGRKEQAIESVKAYLESYPNAPKGLKALDRLGAGADKPPEKPPEGSGGTTPTPTPPTPTPTPTPETGAGSGSG